MILPSIAADCSMACIIKLLLLSWIHHEIGSLDFQNTIWITFILGRASTFNHGSLRSSFVAIHYDISVY